MAVRINVRVNGSSRGVVIKIIPDTDTTEDVVRKAATKLFGNDAAVADPSNASLYLSNGFAADVDVLEKDDMVVVAFSGSPYKTKITRSQVWTPGESSTAAESIDQQAAESIDPQE